MLAIHPSTPQKTTPNLLPTRIHHNGPINSASRYWTPSRTDATGVQHVHFRGRHLHGRSIALPANYTGAVVRVTDELAPAAQASKAQLSRKADEEEEDGEDEDGEEMELESEVETKVAKQIGSFDEIVIWEHGGSVDAERDGFVRGLGEWVEWAGKMHCEDDDEGAVDVEGGAKTKSEGKA